MNKTLHRLYVGLFFLVGITSVVILVVNSYSYYTLPLTERVFSNNHNLFKPSGSIGHVLGILGTFMMIFGVAMYMIRKRTRKLFQFGYLKNWLEFHIFLCTLGPIFVLFHTAFKFGGIVAVSFWSMVAVVASGVIGRFIYIQIPRSIQGQELDFKDIQKMDEELSVRLSGEYKLSATLIDSFEHHFMIQKYAGLSLTKSFSIMLTDYFALRKLIPQLKKSLRESGITNAHSIREIIKLFKAKITLTRKIGLLRTMQRLFNYWHIVHLPFAIIMLVIMIVHVAVTMVFGYKWIF
ncbi:MAG: hypothetical protein M0Q21_06265 [Ignavibacteriaceae bacterium]|nr:hypothetical protein [Ignavibacteriaceae bacterium]